MNAEIVEFTVAPQVNPEDGLPYHEWFVEFGKPPSDIAAFAIQLDEELIRLNTYYKDLIDGKVLQRLKLRHLKKDSFINYINSNSILLALSFNSNIFIFRILCTNLGVFA
jgi:hypothetical protein